MLRKLRLPTLAVMLLAVCIAVLFSVTTPIEITSDKQAQFKTPLIPRAVLFGNPDKAAPRLAPNGKLLAYLTPHNGVLNVCMRTLGQSEDRDRVITSDTQRGIREFFWQYDSEHLLYLQDKKGDENWHLYQTDIASGETRDLTPFANVTAQPIAISHKQPDVMLLGLNKRVPEMHDVYRLNLKDGSLTLDTENPGDVAGALFPGFTADHDLQVRAVQAFLPDGGNEIRVRDSSTSPWRTLLSWGAGEQFGGVAGFTADNKRLLVITSVGANTAQLIEIDPSTGKTRVIAEDKQYDLSTRSGLVTHPTSNELQAISIVRERTCWQFFDEGLCHEFRNLEKLHRGDLSIVSRDLADKTWIVAYEADNAPVHYYLFDRPSGKTTLLFTNRPALEGYTLSTMQPISFKARDGMILYGYLTLPYGASPHNLPLVLDVHGGPYGRNKWELDNEAQWLANRGYAVLQINFRGSTGYGKEYLNAGDREWGRKMHTDLLDGKQWAIEQGFADPSKVAIYGGSYGGYATLVGLAFTPDEFCLGIDIVGPSNLSTLLKSIPAYWKSVRSLFDRRIGNVDTEEEFLKSRSPLFKAEQIKAPLLIAHGANDPRVKQAESDQIVAAMRRNGIPVQYLLFPDEGHGFAQPENRLKFYACAEQFLTKHLGGRAEPPAENETWQSLLK